jgi:ubiquinone/menaquinone biosynthesis C-methylase UbiE
VRHLWFLLVLIAALVSAATAQNGRVLNPRNVEALENESRDAWQKPAEVIKALGIQPSAVVADIGTGSGYFIPYLSQAAEEVHAVDIQQEMLVFVERKIAELGLDNVNTVLSQENDTGLEPDSVDLALLIDVYHELRTPKALLTNIKEILKPNGRLVIIDFVSDKVIPDIGPIRRHRVPEKRLTTEVQATGFQLAERHGFLPYQYFLVFTIVPDPERRRQSS